MAGTNQDVLAGVRVREGSGQSPSRMAQWLKTIDQSRRAPLLGAVLIGAIAILLGWSRLHFRPDMSFTQSFVSGEEGNQLWRADRTLHGQLPYRDFAYPYGFIPSYLYAGFAYVFGNTLLTNRYFHMLCNTGCIVLVYQLLQRWIGTLRAGLYALAFIPFLLAPGGTTGAFTNVESIPVERLCFLAVIALWSPPDRRAVPRAIAIGFVLGLWQATKFGGAFFAGFSVLVVDVAWLLCSHKLRESYAFYLRGLVATGLTFLVLEALWLVAIFGVAPRPLAFDAVWPTYVERAYRELPQQGARPGWAGAAFFITQQWPPLSCAVLGIAAFIALARRNPKQVAWPVLIGWVFFMSAIPLYLGHRFHWYQYAWTLLPAGAWGIASLPKWGKWAIRLSWVPALVLMAKVTYVNPVDPLLSPLKLPNSEVMFVDSKYQQNTGAMVLAAREAAAKGHFVLGLFSWGGGGFHFFYDRNYALRNYMPETCVFRPSDQTELEHKLDLVDAIGPFDGANPSTRLSSILGEHLSTKILANYTLLRSPEGAARALVRDSALR